MHTHDVLRVLQLYHISPLSIGKCCLLSACGARAAQVPMRRGDAVVDAFERAHGLGAQAYCALLGPSVQNASARHHPAKCASRGGGVPMLTPKPAGTGVETVTAACSSGTDGPSVGCALLFQPLSKHCGLDGRRYLRHSPN